MGVTVSLIEVAGSNPAPATSKTAAQSRFAGRHGPGSTMLVSKMSADIARTKRPSAHGSQPAKRVW